MGDDKVEFKNAAGDIVMRINPELRRLEILNPEDSAVIAAYGPIVETGRLNIGVSKIVHTLTINGYIHSGASGVNGNLRLIGSDGKRKVYLEADKAECKLGGDGVDGQLTLLHKDSANVDSAAKAPIHIRASDATVRVGAGGKNGNIFVHNEKNDAVIQMSGKSGDILFFNADCAEEFDVDDPALEPGSVLVLDDEPGRLRVSDAPYDTRVAGILSGAGDYRPAIVLDRKPEREGRRPVALAGKVWCKVDARSAPVGVGSLLTTSSLPGHAMAATDRERAFGAVLGKALAPLAAGVGVVPVLVALQ